MSSSLTWRSPWVFTSCECAVKARLRLRAPGMHPHEISKSKVEVERALSVARVPCRVRSVRCALYALRTWLMGDLFTAHRRRVDSPGGRRDSSG